MPSAHAALEAAARADPALAPAYAARGWRPIWWDGDRPRPEAAALVRMLAASGEDGLDSERYRAGDLAAAVKAAESGDGIARAQADVRLTGALADYAVDLHRPASGAALIVTDPAAAPPAPTRAEIAMGAARAPDLARHLDAVRRVNPVYAGLRSALSAYRTRWARLPQTPVAAGPTLAPAAQGARVAALRRRLGVPGERDIYDPALAAAVRGFQAAHGLPPTGRADAATVEALNAGASHFERLILANLERARALPADPGRRFVVVDAAAARLELYEDGRVVDSMRVIVGKAGQPTPAMAGVIRYAVFEPYWNVPEDLARDRVAARVLTQGPGYLDRQGMEVLSDWSDSARVLAPHEVDWRAVADGRRSLRVRQRPGPGNMMGEVKLMLPNTLGVYLHDTPDKGLFRHARRNFSSGCVRLEDARRLARRLLGPAADPGGLSGPERRVDLPEPVPVYIVYLTAAPGAGGVEFRPDVYARDPALIAALTPPLRHAEAGPAAEPLSRSRR